jgi:Secretion system C-terminal sorting domain
MKRQLVILFFVAFFGLANLNAQTNVSGFINANTTWTLAGSPYIVVGNALLSQGFTLTIDPGVVVKFNSNNALQIDGQLIAIGTPTQRIVFTSNQTSPQPGDWAKLHFSDFSVDATYDASGNYVSGTIMKYCDVLYAGSLMWGSVDVQQCSPYFNHCRIHNGSWNGINFNGEHLTIDSSSIKDCAKRGIYYQGGHFLMRSDTFYSCGEGALHFIHTPDGTQSRITNSFFRQNYGAISWQNNGLQQVTIQNSVFIYNNGPAVVSLQGQRDTIRCNRFRYNTGGPAIEWGDMAYPHCGGIIDNNLIEYNVNQSGPSVFSIGAGYYTGAGDTLFISKNLVTHNSSPGNTCSYFYADLYSNTTRCVQIYDNVFTENDGNSFMRFWGQQNNDPTYDFLYLRNNSFINPLCQYEFYNDIPYGSPNLFLSNNYWGTANTTVVDTKIYDYFDFANQSVVYYMPILQSPIIPDTLCNPFVQPPSSVDDLNKSDGELDVYPNPASDDVTVNLGTQDYSREGRVEVLNALGEVVNTYSVVNTTAVQIRLPEDAGLYFIRYISDKGVYATRIVKK